MTSTPGGPVFRLVRCVQRRREDDGVAMMTAILMVLILGALSVLVLGLVMTQMMPTQFARKNTRTIFAAEAGVEATLNQLRSAANAPDFTGSVYGNLKLLPCTMTGKVADPAGELKYDVTVSYYKDNPAGRSAAWLASATNKLTCTSGSGTAVQPGYAYIVAEGYSETGARLEATQADRTLTSIYQFSTTNTNVAGGRIYTFKNSFCLRADGLTAGSTITYVAAADCGSDDDRELWLYDTDYKIKLAVTTLPGQTQLCITGAPSTSSGTVEAKLQTCETGAARWNQLWSWEGGSRWKGENSTITGYSTYCLYAGTTSETPSNIVGKKLSSGTQCAQDLEWGSFNPDAAVGPGAASYSTHQVVNFLEFGRCFDVTKGQVGSAYMIAYPCKQDPSGGSQLYWNHKWYYNEPTAASGIAAPQQIYVYLNNSTSQKYCLISPGPGGLYPTLTSTCSTTAANQQFVRYQNTGNYSTGYTFVDYLGRCIGIGDKFDAWSKLTVSSCTGGPDQKWNAPPQDIEASIGNYLETYG